MRTLWKVLTVASLILVGCKGDKKGAEAPRPTPAGKSAEPTRTVAGDEYVIQIKFLPDVGRTVAIHQTERKAGSVKTFQSGQWNEEKRDETRESQFRQTLLEAGDKLPRKFKRHYEKATRTTMGVTVPLSYEGQTIVFELVGDRYKATTDGVAIGAVSLGVLAQDVSTEVHLEPALIPGKPVRLHESWPLQPRRLEEVFGRTESLAPGKSRGEATLAKVYQNQGKQFGVINFEITLAVNELRNFRLDTPLTRTWTGSVDAAIDGSSTSINTSRTSKLTGKAQIDGPDKKKAAVEAAQETTGRIEQSSELSGRQ